MARRVPANVLKTAGLPVLQGAFAALAGLAVAWVLMSGRPFYFAVLGGFCLLSAVIVLAEQRDLYELSMMAFFLSLPLMSALVMDVGITIRSTYILALCALMFGLYQGRLPALQRVPALAWLLPFVIFSFFSMIWTIGVPHLVTEHGSQLRGLVLRTLVQNGQLFLMVVILYLTISYCSSVRRLKLAVDLIAVATFFTASYGLYEFAARFFGFHFIYINNGLNNLLQYGYHPASMRIGRFLIPRPASTFDEPKNLANFLMFGSLLCGASLAGPQSRRSRLFKWATLVVAGIVFVLANSRGAFIGAFCALAAAAVHRRRVGILLRGVALTGIALGALSLLVSLTLIPGFRLHDVITTVAFRVQQSINLVGRKRAWEMALKVIEGHPVFGVGFGNLTFYMAHQEGLNHVDDVPSLYLRLFAELGVVGLLLFLAFILRLLAGVFGAGRRKGLDPWSGMMCTGVLAAMVADLVQRASFVGFVTDGYLWVLWGLAIAVTRIAAADRPPANGVPPVTASGG